MVRTSDETVEPSERVRRILAPYGSGNDVVVVSNHINAGGGALTCCSKQKMTITGRFFYDFVI